LAIRTGSIRDFRLVSSRQTEHRTWLLDYCCAHWLTAVRALLVSRRYILALHAIYYQPFRDPGTAVRLLCVSVCSHYNYLNEMSFDLGHVGRSESEVKVTGGKLFFFGLN